MENEMRYEKDGMVAVLVSPGFGAGWSSWAADTLMEAALFHPKLVQAALDDVVCVDDIVEELFGYEHFYTGGWRDIVVMWVPKGAKFRIHEYDGSESLILLQEEDYFTA
jgi:hypothetical protein